MAAILCPKMGAYLDTSGTKLSSSDTTLTKPNELLVMVPVVGRLSPVSRKIFNALLFKGGGVYRDKLNAGAPMLAEETFEARLSDLVSHLPGEPTDWSSNARAHLMDMLRTEVVWQSIDKNADVEGWGAMNLLSQAEVEKRGGALYVRWSFPPRVLAALKDPAFYTRLDLEIMGSLRTYAAIALYEICSRYRTNPTGLTCNQPPDWWVEALTARGTRGNGGRTKGKGGREDDFEARPKREWRKVKSESVIDAVAEINAKTDLEIELIEKRTGKAVTSVQFSVRRKRQSVGAGEGVPPDIVEKATALGISIQDIAGLLKSVTGGAEVLRAALMKVADRVRREDLAPVDSPLAYLRRVIDEFSQYVAPDEKPQAPTTRASANTLPSSPFSERNEVVDVVETAASRTRKLVEALPREEQIQLAEQAFQTMKERGLATAAIGQAYARYVGGGPLVGILLGEMVRLYLAKNASQ